MWSTVCELISLRAKKPKEELKAVDAVPVDMIKGRINDLKKMLMDIDEDDIDLIWNLRIEIGTLRGLLEMWEERKEK